MIGPYLIPFSYKSHNGTAVNLAPRGKAKLTKKAKGEVIKCHAFFCKSYAEKEVAPRKD